MAATTNVNSGLEGRPVSLLVDLAEGNDLDGLERLLGSSGVQIDEQDVSGRTGLIIASTKGYEKIVELLLGAGANALVHDENQSTCLHYAVEGNDKNIVTLLLERSSVDVFATNLIGESPVSIAYDRKSNEVMNMLLGAEMDKAMKLQPRGTDVTSGTENQNQRGRRMREYHSKLWRVSVGLLRTSPESYGDETFVILRTYLKHTINAATYKSTANEVTMMHSAAYDGSVEELEVLLDLPVTSTLINEFDEDEQTPLHYAAMEGNLAAVKVLAARDTIKPNVLDRHDRTALQIAMEKNWRYIVFHLLEYPDVQADQDSLYRTKEAMVNAANAILVGGALIASVTFASLLQPPLGWVPYVNLDHTPMGVFWVYNGLAFFTALVTVVCGTRTVVPEYTVYIREEVKMISIRLKITAILFFVSSDLLFLAYGVAGIAVLNPDGNDRWYTIALVIIGSVVYSTCMILFVCFSSKRRATTKPHLRPSLGWGNQEVLADVHASDSYLKRAWHFFPPFMGILPNQIHSQTLDLRNSDAGHNSRKERKRKHENMDKIPEYLEDGHLPYKPSFLLCADLDSTLGLLGGVKVRGNYSLTGFRIFALTRRRHCTQFTTVGYLGVTERGSQTYPGLYSCNFYSNIV